ncbi:hypothetical protein DFH06DRAFT_1340092 [Mycena polygramma]|nr:hypothetical protein DFH06DRAFT_1340092 [Mycena polygramma]
MSLYTGRPTVSPMWQMLDGFVQGIMAENGIQPQEGEVPGVRATFTLEVNIHGKTKRVDILFDVVTVGWYDMYQDTEIEALYRDLIERIGPEISQNSEAWTCLNCDLPPTDIA